MKINRKKANKKVIMTIATVVVALCIMAGYVVYAKSSQVWPFEGDHSSSRNGTANKKTNKTRDNTGSVSSSIEDHAKNGGGSGQDESSTSGGVSDTGGKDTGAQSGGVSSQSGNITLYTPGLNQNISGDIVVTGAAKVPEVFYRISDDVHGMINSGKLSVHDGRFSGNLSVSTTAKRGTFEVYSFNVQGQEVNNINIAVGY